LLSVFIKYNILLLIFLISINLTILILI
jgi:hypothetical protein